VALSSKTTRGANTTAGGPVTIEKLRGGYGASERYERKPRGMNVAMLSVVRDVLTPDLVRELMREVDRDELRRLETTNPPRVRPRPATDPGRTR
jgi:hypothetical protein